ncbi:RPA-interacting protein B-like [Styela clava]
MSQKIRSTVPSSKHADLYKLGSPPTWKESYKRRCAVRLKGSRAKLLQRYRDLGDVDTSEYKPDLDSSVVDDVMREEWDLMQNTSETDFNAMLDTMEQIKLELMLQEREILMQYDRMKEFDESTFKNVVSEHDSINNSHVVPCPICHSNYLEKHLNIIVCKCGVQIDTEQDCITLQHIDVQLRVGVNSHTEHCDAKPVFGLIENLGSKNLLMSCNSCDFMFVVI